MDTEITREKEGGEQRRDGGLIDLFMSRPVGSNGSCESKTHVTKPHVKSAPRFLTQHEGGKGGGEREGDGQTDR